MTASLATRIAVAAIALGGFAAGAAHARSDVQVSIGLGVPAPVYVQPAPVYVQPAPVYVQPRPVYTQPPVYVQPAPVYIQQGYGWVPPGHRRGHEWRARGGWGDADRDGVPNRYDRQPGNPWRH